MEIILVTYCIYMYMYSVHVNGALDLKAGHLVLNQIIVQNALYSTL